MIKPPYKISEVRPQYAGGMWRYAVGRPAEEHTDYAAAVREAERGGWNPWWIRSVSDVTATLAGCYLDERRGRKVADFFPAVLRHHKGAWAGQRFTLMDWQMYDLTIPLFGWTRPDGGRRFTKAGVWTPKKNGKSGYAAGVGIYLLRGDGMAGPEVYVAATKMEQANIIHRTARAMVKHSPSLSRRLTVLSSTSRIISPDNDGIFAALSAEERGHEGLDWSGLLIDELHVVDYELFATLIEGGIARHGKALALTISTAGEFDPLSVGWDQWRLAELVGNGDSDDWSFFALRYFAKDKTDIDDPAVWWAANPSMGIIFDEDQFRESHKKAKLSPIALSKHRRYRLNQWVRATHSWLNTAKWLGEKQSVSIEQLHVAKCWGALDLSSVRDLTCFGLLFELPGKLFWLPFFWLPEGNIEELSVSAQAPYSQWAQDGHLFLTPGDVIDQDAVLEFISGALKEFNVQEIAYDPYKATNIVANLENAGVAMVKFSQGTERMSPAIREMERRILRGEIAHGGNPVMNWMLASAETHETSQGNVRLVKTVKKERKKIDGVVCLVMAGDCQNRASLTPTFRSRYEDPDEKICVVDF